MRGPAYVLMMCLASTIVCSAQELGTSGPSWSVRGVFAFDSLVLDFKKQLEVFGPMETTLVDCSDRDYFCAYADVVHLILPRRCNEFKIGETWSAHDVKTTVLNRYTEDINRGIHSIGPQQVLLLGNPKFPATVYEYVIGQGVRGIFWDPNKDLVGSATSSTQGAFASANAASYLRLETLDPFGQCAK